MRRAAVIAQAAVAIAAATTLLGPATPEPTPAPPTPQESPELSGEALAELQRRLLNAVLVPMLESEGPLVWAEPTELSPCRENSSVTVDGSPLAGGRTVVPGRPVELRLRLDDCWPLGTSWMGLTGIIDMTLMHLPGRLEASIRPHDLTVAADGRRRKVTQPLFGELSLAAPGHRP